MFESGNPARDDIRYVSVKFCCIDVDVDVDSDVPVSLTKMGGGATKNSTVLFKVILHFTFFQSTLRVYSMTGFRVLPLPTHHQFR